MDKEGEGSVSVAESETGGAAAVVESKNAEDVHPFEIFKAEGNTFVKMEKYAEALEKYGEAWNNCRTDDDRAMILNNRGVVFEKMGDTEKALETFKEALELKPGYIKVLVRRALVYKKLKRFEDALDDVTEAHVLAMKNNQTVAGLQDTCEGVISEYAEQEIEKLSAEREFGFPNRGFIRAFLRSFYCDPVSRFWKGLDPPPLDEVDAAQGDAKKRGFLAALDCLKSEKYSDVLEHCTTEIENEDGKYRFEALLLRGSVKFLAGLKDEAQADFKSVIDDEGASNEIKSSAHLKSALVANLWESPEAAAAEFAAAEQLWKENADVYYHAAVCLVDKGEPIPALALLEKGMEICSDPRKYPLLHVMGITIRLSYDACVSSPEDAFGKLKQLQVDGVFDTPECYELYAQTLLIMEGGDGAFAQFDRAVEASGGEKHFLLKKLMAQQIVQNEPEATISALMEHADDPDIGSGVWYHIGEMYFMQGKREEAFEAIDKSIALAPSVYDIRMRVMGKMDFKYNVILSEKLQKHEINLFQDIDALRDKALE